MTFGPGALGKTAINPANGSGSILGAQMGIGVGLVLIAIGAVLTFAVHVVFSGVNIHVIGAILMIVGALGVIIELTVFAPRRRSVTTYSTAVPTATPTSQTTRIES
jgi:hypothetical protein